ncbi:helix-turn-helix transcriptional regulator [Sphingomonas sp. BIUV-7]|uniref:Helix-turn-helix transcriptional regulator n=1 Tax=Sphingomonas natans TaxID=3063330 RepID=A0ABT8YBN2_9SPHN|nr:helix-turn-helix transcriptional regulator [Sphingomonas sp. BIUV-7]MDO6415407.1 helix-turn-helix transcriptional regulator [Sphingomonas sp. BIUV-7]
MGSSSPFGLSPREIQVMRLVDAGLETKEIARELNVAPATVNNQVQSAKAKIGISSRRKAARVLVNEFDGHGERITSEPKTLPGDAEKWPNQPVSNDGEPQASGQADHPAKEYAVFDTSVLIRPEPVPDHGRRNRYDTLTRVGMILMQVALCAIATAVMLWIYDRS